MSHTPHLYKPAENTLNPSLHSFQSSHVQQYVHGQDAICRAQAYQAVHVDRDAHFTGKVYLPTVSHNLNH